MKRHIILTVLFAIVSVLITSPCVFAAVDIVPYLALEEGKWAIWQVVGSMSRDGYVTKNGENGQIVREWYEDNGSGWTFEGSEILEVTPTAVLLIGSYDGTDQWVFEPTVSLPRPMKLNRPVFYKGVLRNQRTNAKQRVIHVFMITKEGIIVDAPAGTFENCIKTKSYGHQAGVSRESVSLMCPGRAEAKDWVSKIKDTTDPQVETQNAFNTEVIQFGDSNPPFP